jgi:hypothetical protein
MKQKSIENFDKTLDKIKELSHVVTMSFTMQTALVDMLDEVKNLSEQINNDNDA